MARSLACSRRHLSLLSGMSRLAVAAATGEQRWAIKRDRTIPFSLREVYDVVFDVGSYRHFVPYCTESRVTRTISPTEFDADLAITFMAFQERYTSRVVVAPPPASGDVIDGGVVSVRANSVEGSALFASLSSEWTMRAVAAPGGGGTAAEHTHVHFEADFEVRSPLHAHAVALFIDDVADMQLDAFAKRCTSTCGPS